MKCAYVKTCGNICFTSLIQKQLRFYVRERRGWKTNSKGKKEKNQAEGLQLACRGHAGVVLVLHEKQRAGDSS